MIPINYTLRLEDYSPDLLSFLKNTTQSELSIPAPPIAGFAKAGIPPLNVDTLRTVTDENGAIHPLRVFWSITETWNVIEATSPIGTPIGSIKTIVPCEQTLSADIKAFLFLANGHPNLTPTFCSIIIDAFRDFPKGTDPTTYTESIILKFPGITKDMFTVGYAPVFKKIGDVTTHPQQKDHLLGMYTRETPVLDLPEGQSFNRFRRAVKVGEETDFGVPKTPTDPRQKIIEPGQTLTGILDSVITKEASALDCSKVTKRQEFKIATLLQFPEFKVEWRPASARVGCVTMTVWYPVLQIRLSSLNLWAYVARPTPMDAEAVFTRIFESCALEAAYSSAVIGVAMGNFVAALQAFRALFQECIRNRLEDLVSCLIPGLMMLTEIKHDWQDI